MEKLSGLKKFGIALITIGGFALLGAFQETSDVLLGILGCFAFIALGSLCIFIDAKIQKKKSVSLLLDLDRQVKCKDYEHHIATNSTFLAPDIIAQHKRNYHYPDVEIWVNWQYGGFYGKSCENAGIKRGNMLDLIYDPNPDDPDAIAVVWEDQVIGHLKSNRLRGMVRQWQSEDLPIFCAVSHVGGETKILIELAFYGFVKYK